MKITYDAGVDALAITFREATVTTRHLDEGVSLDFDSEGNLAGIEILDASKRMGGPEPYRQITLEGLGLRAPA